MKKFSRKPTKTILTAGPKISPHDLSYVRDAAKNGWNTHHSDYLYKFQEAFAKYIGVKHALAVPCGTHALHLSLVLFGVGPGDEVIIPDMTYVACSNAVHYTGATPILVDIDRETWSIDVAKVEKEITKKTKAIMPVHLYGNVAAMTEIRQLAKKYNLLIVEDACEGLGCTLNGKQVGSLGDAAAFSFQGAKMLAIGEGGMFVTNRSDWYERALSLTDHGVSLTKQFWIDEVGYMYPMSNIQGALGLSRLEDIDDLIERKRKVYQWYKERLSDIEGLSLNPERKGVRSSFWMSSIVLNRKFKVDRDTLRKKLKEVKIDTRSFFYPISDFHLYNTKDIKTPVSHDVAYNGINLPSGAMLTEEKVDYVTSMIRKILLG